MNMYKEDGFTLVELMITVVVSGIIVAAIYSTYIVQQRTYIDQDAVVEMQQNIRAALMLMSREIRMAGFRGNGDAQAGFQLAARDALVLTADLDEDGDTSDSGENIGYDLYITDEDELTKIGWASSDNALEWSELPENSGHYEISGHQPLAENIEQLEFNYILSDGSTTTSPTSGQLNQIRAVQVSILARAGTPDREFINTKLYCPASHPNHNLTTSPPQCEDSAGDSIESATWGPYNDNYRRRLLITTIQCRNMGL